MMGFECAELGGDELFLHCLGDFVLDGFGGFLGVFIPIASELTVFYIVVPTFAFAPRSGADCTKFTLFYSLGMFFFVGHPVPSVSLLGGSCQ
jgi:hypothetical protein